MVASWPDGRVHPSLFALLERYGFSIDDEHLRLYQMRDTVCAYNTAVRDLALRSPFNSFVFADNDLIYGPGTQPWFFVKADVVCVEYDIGHPANWQAPTEFHTGLWRTSREVLERMTPPWFMREDAADGTRVTKCPCM